MTLQELVNEYEQFEPKNTNINSSTELYERLLVYQDDIKESIKAYKRELKENKSMELDAKLRNFFFFIFQEEETSFYYFDNALIKEIINEMYAQIENIKDLMLLVDDSNYKDLTKLVEFMIMHYDNNIDFLEKERIKLELTMENVTLNNNIRDTREKIDLFVEQIITAYYERLINIEKMKKI